MIKPEIVARIRREVRANIDKYGQHVWGIGGGGEDTPAFCYSVGNLERGLPELLIIGEFPMKLSTIILNTIGRHMRKSERLDAGELDLDWTFPFRIREAGGDVRSRFTYQVDRFYRGQACYRPDYRVMQVMICDPRGRYPGDPGCEDRYDVECP